MNEPIVCQHCRQRPAALWCDFVLGTLAEVEQIPLPLDDTNWPASLASDYMTRQEFDRMLSEMRADPAPLATCDAATCRACAEQHGWQRVGHICGKGGCETIDHCPTHAKLDNLGKSAPLHRPDAVKTLQRDAWAKNARAGFKVERRR